MIECRFAPLLGHKIGYIILKDQVLFHCISHGPILVAFMELSMVALSQNLRIC